PPRSPAAAGALRSSRRKTSGSGRARCVACAAPRATAVLELDLNCFAVLRATYMGACSPEMAKSQPSVLTLEGGPEERVADGKRDVEVPLLHARLVVMQRVVRAQPAHQPTPPDEAV